MLTKADRERLKELTPEMVERWLAANGWESPGGSVLIFEIWTHPEHGMLNLHGLMIVPDPAKKDAHLYRVVSALEDLAKRIDRYPHEILAEMVQPGCKVETVVWFRFGDRQPEEGQRVVLQENVTADFINGVWCQAFCTCETNPDDLWRPPVNP